MLRMSVYQSENRADSTYTFRLQSPLQPNVIANYTIKGGIIELKSRLLYIFFFKNEDQ